MQETQKRLCMLVSFWKDFFIFYILIFFGFVYLQENCIEKSIFAEEKIWPFYTLWDLETLIGWYRSRMKTGTIYDKSRLDKSWPYEF